MEVAFKRDGEWQRAIYPRSVIFSSRSITTLADLGCTITSENSKNVVKFLGALESENIDIIPQKRRHLHLRLATRAAVHPRPR